ncbi:MULTISPECIES: signal peptidase II [unclassified Enterococcus]|uniref:signal peptidase II n=1 Tax=unclassified Enterococcus TaxID=2608891 RepID=UPI003D2B5CEF
MLIYLIISAVIVGLDQWVKWEIVEQFALGETKEVIPNILSLTHIRNTGAAWSILEGKMWFFIPITIIAAAVILYMMYKYRKDGSKWLMVGLSLILAGAIGNFIDRVRFGHVVDMFQTDFINFPIFNVADTSLVIGVICAMIYIILDEKESKKK